MPTTLRLLSTEWHDLPKQKDNSVLLNSNAAKTCLHCQQVTLVRRCFGREKVWLEHRILRSDEMICGPTPAEEKNGGKGRLSSPFWAKGLFSGAFTLVSGRVKNFTYITMFTDARNRLIDAKYLVNWKVEECLWSQQIRKIEFQHYNEDVLLLRHRLILHNCIWNNFLMIRRYSQLSWTAATVETGKQDKRSTSRELWRGIFAMWSMDKCYTSWLKLCDRDIRYCTLFSTCAGFCSFRKYDSGRMLKMS